MDPADDSDLRAGRFRYKGELLAYEELAGDEAQTVFDQHFAEWA